MPYSYTAHYSHIPESNEGDVSLSDAKEQLLRNIEHVFERFESIPLDSPAMHFRQEAYDWIVFFCKRRRKIKKSCEGCFLNSSSVLGVSRCFGNIYNNDNHFVNCHCFKFSLQKFYWAVKNKPLVEDEVYYGLG